MGEWFPKLRLPLVEGKCPPTTRMNENGQLESYYPEEDPDYVDPEIRETDTYMITDKEEFYDYLIVCKACETEFIAYHDMLPARNYCPFCGKRLETPDEG